VVLAVQENVALVWAIEPAVRAVGALGGWGLMTVKH